jgi:hypothetical protein
MSSLETSITLEDVFTVVEAKRVPLAPELAGYLALEIGDGTDAGSGDVDPKTVFISEEGTVALVRPKRDVVTGDAEASVRTLLTKLLEASGSGTPALTTAAKRKPGNGLPALVEELEAALIPVNRAAGRRALARLVREVKRVLLGVGRNASVPPLQSRPEPKPVITGGAGGTASAVGRTAPHARPVLRKRESDPKFVSPVVRDSKPVEAAKPELRRPGAFEEESPTATRSNQLSELVSNMNAVESEGSKRLAGAVEAAVPPPAPSVEPPEAKPETPRAPVARLLPGSSPRPPAAGLPPPPVKSASGPPAPPPQPKREPTAPPPPVITEMKHEPVQSAPVAPTVLSGDEVDSLLDSFGVSAGQEDKQIARELKAIAGLSPTPPPPDAKTLAELTKDVGKDLPKRLESSSDGDSVEALLALTDASAPVRAPAPAAAPPVVAAPPPSPLFGGSSGASASSTAGAPAALRSVEAPPAKEERNDREVASARVPDAPKARPVASAPTRAQEQTGKRARVATGGQRPRAPKTGVAMLIAALLVLAGATVATWKYAPQVFTGKRHTASTASAVPTVVAPPAPKCKVALVLTEVPANAEILLRVGQAPVDVERMPVGTRLEFVATAEGYAPRRAVIKGESPWDKGSDGKPRIEVPIQLDPSKAKPGSVDPWPAAEPGSQVGGSGSPGVVHIISNVRGAEVWLLAGLGPEARIDQLRCDGDIDVLFAGPPTLRKRLHVSEKDITATASDAAGNKVVNISAKDPPK